MPGVLRLAEELGVHQTTVGDALRELERQGLLVSRGPGRRRLIRIPAGTRIDAGLRVGVLLHEPQDHHQPYLIKLKHQLHEAGHSTHLAAKSLTEIGMDAHRLPEVVRAFQADAWVVVAGSREVLRWFAEQPPPAFALFGRMRRQSVAGSGPEKTPAYVAVARRLLALGHRRIVYVTDAPKTYENPGRLVGAFLGELDAAGIATGPYNMPDWEPSPAGLRGCLDALFAKTPPTALLVDGPQLFAATQQHLSRCGIHAPEQVSLVCTDPHPHFEWGEPTIAHIHWDLDPIIRRAVRWADHVARGKSDLRKSLFKARFIDGGTVGPAPKARCQPARPELTKPQTTKFPDGAAGRI